MVFGGEGRVIVIDHPELDAARTDADREDVHVPHLARRLRVGR
jgi:hypothetical protein